MHTAVKYAPGSAESRWPGREGRCAGTEDLQKRASSPWIPDLTGEVQQANKQYKDGEPERDGIQVEELSHAEVLRFEI